MEKKDYLLNPSALVELGKRLSDIQKVSKYDTEDEKEGWTLAHTFSDLEESFRQFIDVFIPKLVSRESTDEGIEEALFNIGEEFRHIIYHMRDTKYYNYLFD